MGSAVPLGEWQVTGQVFPPGWFRYGDISQDLAFLIVRGEARARARADGLGSVRAPGWRTALPATPGRGPAWHSS
jgi:hypothetical protein